MGMNHTKATQRKRAALIGMLIAGAITGCNGGGGSSADSNSDSGDSTKTGRFVDSPVANLKYTTPSQSGSTNADGEFRYKQGESITFRIGDLEFPETGAEGTMSPLTLAGTTDTSDLAATNMARLLQSLDEDGNPDNGISILGEAHTSATGISNIDFSAQDFDNNSEITNLVANSGSTNSSLVSAEAARSHLESQTITTILELETPDGVFDDGTRTLTLRDGYATTEAAASVCNLDIPGVVSPKVEFLPDSSGSIVFEGDEEPYNTVNWSVSESGTLQFTEESPWGNTWNWTLTPIGPTGDGENVLVELSTPEGQEDFANGHQLGTLSRFNDDTTPCLVAPGGVTPVNSSAGDSITAELVLKTSAGVFSEGSRSLTRGNDFTSAEIEGASCDLTLLGSTTSIALNTGGAGDYGDSSITSWSVTGGTLEFTEEDEWGATWDWTLTPIEPTSTGQDVVIELQTPDGQEDYAVGAHLAKFSCS